ncbi:hypothetical protein BDA99DRAFT_562145 [Phascolomyces articulosus]|uniref:Uncharacterized protein n=1 Tax=Phascolomyces articulosus TaxID=60185 RepID=A0AAD5JV69_9FUNG|nr:hypothetical protein BDA99DRAFT_562145 [Phascolomyces articulosus]
MSSSSSSFKPYKKQSRMTAFFPKQSEPQEYMTTTAAAATRAQVREEYQQVVERIESLAEDDNELWNLNQEQQSMKSLHEQHGDLSKLVSRPGGPTIQPRITKKKNLDSAIAKMKAKCLIPQQQEQPQQQKPTTDQIKVATLRSDSSLSAKDFEQRLKERIKAKSKK